MEELLETAAPSEEAIDSAWEEELGSAGSAEEQDWEPDADQPTEKPDTDAPENGALQAERQTSRQTPKPEGGEEATFTLKHLDEVRTVSKDEVVKLAQQGMDYDRIRAERDQLRSFRQQADPSFSLISFFAKKSGMEAEQYLEHLRKQDLIRSGFSEQSANARLSAERIAAERAQEDLRREQAKTEARNASMKRFLKAYPDVKPEEIPKEVWKAVSKGDDLTAAFTFHKNRALEAELAAERQNGRNAQISTGSMSTRGAGKQDEIDRWWNDE
ncbi:hypothetical protein SDC9_62043 [bioreactor metagenome]|uniref:Uncharacterized protein n=1 Tax=bioreactor metagenome TaxID=1076179 RepID=A0A644XHH9_9ZZZZ